VKLESRQTPEYLRESFSEYVAHLQLHMTLHARKLIPSLSETGDHRQQMLHQSQSQYEKLASRQGLL
jgi:arsenate reductase-like glutaredoxin family protein